MASQENMHIELKFFTDAIDDFNQTIKQLDSIKSNIEANKNKLLNVWSGKACKSFEKQYKFLFGQVSDIKDSLVEINETLTVARDTFINLDQEIGKSMSQANK